MKILKLCYEFPPIGGGGGRVADGLSRQLALMGHPVDLVTMSYRNLPTTEKTGNLRIYRTPCIRTSPILCHAPEMLIYIISALPKALQMIRKQRYDLIHAHFIFPDGIIAFLLWQMTGLPYLITAHGSDVPGYNPDRFIQMHKVLSPLWRMVAGSSKKIVCLSRFLEVLVKSALPSAKTIVIPNGFDMRRFSADRKKTGNILIITRMFKRKGVQYVLEAIQELDMDAEVHIVGDGPYLNRLKQLAKTTHANIYFHGFLDNRSEKFKELLENASIFVFPSESENFPLVLLEAMAAGLAIITTKNTGCEEVVGDTGLLVDPGDTKGLRKALKTFLDSPVLRAQYGKMARKRLEEHFSWEVVAGMYVEVYKNTFL